LPVKSASLTIGSIDLTRDVTADMTSAKFVVDLKAGTTCIETSLSLGEKGKTLRTDCVYVEYVGEADVASAGNYVPSVPDQVLRDNYQQKVLPFD
jgi:hypothetical protein